MGHSTFDIEESDNSRHRKKETAAMDRQALAELWLDRDLTWLEFNRRVLAEAEDERTPLLERLKFLAIFTSNLDEFFMKRIAVLRLENGTRARLLDDLRSVIVDMVRQQK